MRAARWCRWRPRPTAPSFSTSSPSKSARSPAFTRGFSSTPCRARCSTTAPGKPGAQGCRRHRLRGRLAAAPCCRSNVESFRNLEVNLGELGIKIDEIPLVLQYNKRDLPEVCSVAELREALNTGGWPEFETSALDGTGIFEVLREISKLTLISLKKQLEDGAAETLRRRRRLQLAAPSRRRRRGARRARGSAASPTTDRGSRTRPAGDRAAMTRRKRVPTSEKPAEREPTAGEVDRGATSEAVSASRRGSRSGRGDRG